jgi:3-methyladenine DNA glycosylase AlkC
MVARKSGNTHPWEDPFTEALRRWDLDSAVEALYRGGGGGGPHRPSSKELGKAVALLREYASGPEQLWEWGLRLADYDLGTNLGCQLLTSFFPDRADDLAVIWLRLADHSDWEVREDAAWMVSEFLLADFEEAYAWCLQWVRDSSENVRRAVVVGVKVAAKARVPEWGHRLLDLIEPLLSDRSVYVRKNLGPFAIGDGLLRCYPELTLKRLARWARRSDEQTRWNVAMAFSAAEAAKHVDSAISILTYLAADERRFVWRGVASAMRNLGRRRPTETVPVLQSWLQDEARRQVAELALEHIPRYIAAPQ